MKEAGLTHPKAMGFEAGGSFEAHGALYTGRLPTVLARRARPAVTQACNQSFGRQNVP